MHDLVKFSPPRLCSYTAANSVLSSSGPTKIKIGITESGFIIIWYRGSHYMYNDATISLTSSISSRETFLLSLLEMEAEPESGTGASVALLSWSLWDSCEAWVISGVFLDSFMAP